MFAGAGRLITRRRAPPRRGALFRSVGRSPAAVSSACATSGRSICRSYASSCRSIPGSHPSRTPEPGRHVADDDDAVLVTDVDPERATCPQPAMPEFTSRLSSAALPGLGCATGTGVVLLLPEDHVRAHVCDGWCCVRVPCSRSTASRSVSQPRRQPAESSKALRLGVCREWPHTTDLRVLRQRDESSRPRGPRCRRLRGRRLTEMRPAIGNAVVTTPSAGSP